MSAADLYRRATEAGVTLRLVGGVIKAAGNPEALEELVPQLREHKSELIMFMGEAHRVADNLLQAAMRAAAHWKDDPALWMAQCLEVPPHQRADLLAHLQQTYGGPRHE